MGEELDVPIKNYSPKNAENTYLKYGLNTVQGWKKSMEDYVIDFTDPDKENFLNVFGIFDGHGGSEVPKYLSAHFIEYLQKNANFQKGKYKEALTETFFELDKSFTTEEARKELEKYSQELKPSKEQEIKDINNLCAPGEKLNEEELEQIMAFNEVFDPRNIENANIAEFTGSTGIIIFLGDKNIYIANAGNSRCLVINKEGALINKTKDHTMKDPEEKKRVELARSFNDEEEKKKGEDQGQAEYLDSTRGFGDWEFKGNEWIDQKDQEVSVEPEILEVPINDVQYLILGSHGMFESASNDNENDESINAINNQVCKFFMDEIKKDANKPYSNIIQEYFEKIMPEKNDGNNCIGLDNMSCVVINLVNDTISQFIKKKEILLEERKKKEEEEKKRKREEDKRKREEERKKKEEERKKEEEKKKVDEQKKEEPKKEEEQKNVEQPKKEEEQKKEEEPKKEENIIKEDNVINEENKNVIKEDNKDENKIEEKKDEIKEEKKEAPPEEKKEN